MTGKSSIVSFNFVAQSVRIVMVDDNPWFVAVDVCSALTIANSRDAVAKLDDDERQVVDFAAVGNTDSRENQRVSNFDPKVITIINESGLYSLILTSRKPEAKKFKKWVTSEVLPAIRKTGRYVAAPAQEAPELVSGNDMRNLSRLVWLMTHQFRSKNAFVQAVWHALRAYAGVPSPQRFQVRHIPVLASEVRRIYSITRALAELIAEAEQTVIRRILRHGENAEKVLAETRALLAQSSADDLQEANGCLQRWSEQEIARFVERRPIGSNVLYPDATEPSLNL